MNDFHSFEKTIVRELSCRLCLCTDVVKLKPLSSEMKRKIKKLFEVVIRSDDNLPKAICHDCLQQISSLYLYTIKVDKTQKFLEFYKVKMLEDKRESPNEKMHQLVTALSAQNVIEEHKKVPPKKPLSTPSNDHQQGDSKAQKLVMPIKKKTMSEMKYMEAMTLEEFANTEKVDKQLLSTSNITNNIVANKVIKNKTALEEVDFTNNDSLDPVVIIDGRPAKTGADLDKQITLFYKMECCICHQNGFHFRSLMKHYKNRHGVPGYVTCCEKKFHYFYPKKIIEHMAYHLQPSIFMCPSCHENFQTSQELFEHQSNGGRSEGKIICPRCSQRYPTYRELGVHILTHRIEKLQCDYCGKQLKHHHRKKTINHMEDLILCSQCIRTLRGLEKQEKEIKEKHKGNSNDAMTQKHRKFKQAMCLSGDDDDASTD